MIENSVVLLDTCILSNLLSKVTGLANETSSLLEALMANGNTLYISHFSHYELLRGANVTQKAKIIKLLEDFVTIENSNARLLRAVELHNGYANNVNIKKSLGSISDIDIFLGALIFTDKKPLLLTADYNDFPRPFFTEVEIQDITFQKKGVSKTTIYYYFLQANIDEFFR